MINLLFKSRLLLVSLIFSLIVNTLQAQQQEKSITNLSLTWIGVNSSFRISNKWGIIADANYRSNQFFKSDYNSIVRAGISYWVTNDVTLQAGYAHQWTPSKTIGWHTIANENRLYQQVLVASKVGRVSISNRLRNEERWQEKIVADTKTQDFIFTNRIRYQIMFVVPLTKMLYFPSFVLSDEVMLQMGKTIVYNTFDQNRAYIGLRETFSKQINCDVGYIISDQQKSTGYQYERDHAFRVFIFYNLDVRKKG